VLPEPFRSVWADRALPPAVIAACGLPTDATLRIADATVWSKADRPADLVHLADHVADLVRDALSRRQSVVERRVVDGAAAPQAAVGLPFPARAAHALANAGCLENTSWWERATVHDVASLRGIGARTLLGILALLEHDGVATATARAQPLDVALRALVADRVSARHVPTVLRRLGWDGRGGCTLAEVGREQGVTRERVRQLEAATLGRLRREDAVPALDRAIALLDEAATPEGVDAVSLLLDAALTAQPFLPAGVVTAAAVFDRAHCFEVADTPRRVRVAVTEPQRAEVQRALLSLAGQAHIAHVNEVVARCRAAGVDVDARAVRAYAQRASRVEWLDDGRTWLWVRGRRDPSAVGEARDVLAVGGPQPVAVLQRQLARSPRSARVGALPPPVFERWCRAAGFDVDGGCVRSRERLDAEQVVSPTEYALVQAIAERGGVARARELVAAFAARGLSGSSAGTLLVTSPLFERLGRGVYRVVGTALTPAAVERVEQAAGSVRGVVGGGHTCDGAVWAAYRAATVLRRDRVPLPPVVSLRCGPGVFSLIDGDGRPAGTLTITADGDACGLRSALRMRRPRRDGIVVVAVDVTSRQAVVLTGDARMAERYADGEGSGPGWFAR
jgi:hypothetical protein